ncbi:DUF4234 domain-containing protein [Streptomyces rhizosphaerihabitans]|uniref:DUF4234 domain-containing protein n=1 Tax=Streptomyces rhizosphaerihabitans TaxID=1266770 RepID=UPI0021C1BA72|nr:DUF4234 domain-containing protein [Streptomyces rhizosphaerihabitans]MCT9003567.1 DUF4234 domain-containing protein [Streptomyces rhizosphaerihabitans]
MSNEDVNGRRNLANAIGGEVAAGYRIESQTDSQAVLVKGSGTNHVLHLILSLITCGFWAIVWAVMYFVAKPKRLILTLDEFGNVLRQDVN